jgi:hypothetical protein
MRSLISAINNLSLHLIMTKQVATNTMLINKRGFVKNDYKSRVLPFTQASSYTVLDKRPWVEAE